jgi:hypothetical protein
VKYSTWQNRWLVWTKDIICFARVGQEQLIDAIPLSEIKSIESVRSNPMDRAERQSSSQHLMREVLIVCAPLEGKRSVPAYQTPDVTAVKMRQPHFLCYKGQNEAAVYQLFTNQLLRMCCSYGASVVLCGISCLQKSMRICTHKNGDIFP